MVIAREAGPSCTSDSISERAAKMSAVLTVSPSSPVSTIWMRWVLANAVPQVLLILAIIAAASLGSWKFDGAGLDHLAKVAQTIKISSFMSMALGLLAIH